MIALIRSTVNRVYRSAVGWSLVFAALRAGGNLLVLPLMLRKLSPEDLGFWYVFLSLSGLGSLIDMGFYPTMTRVTAYLWAGAETIQKFGVAGVTEDTARGDRTPNYRLLADLVKTMRIYYIVLALLVTVDPWSVWDTLAGAKSSQLPILTSF